MISNYLNLVTVLVIALGSISNASKCYECTEYVNSYPQALSPNEHFLDFNREPKSINNLCHDLKESRLLRDCSGPCTYAVVQSDKEVSVIYRACDSTLSCANFKNPLPDSNLTSCLTCAEDECNRSVPDSAASIGVSAFFIFASFLVTYISVLS